MRRRNDQSIGEVIRAFFEDNPGIRQKILEVRVERAWGETCGPTILRYTRNLFMKGTVLHVDDLGTVHCAFDNGRQLGLVPGEDSFHKIAPRDRGDAR